MQDDKTKRFKTSRPPKNSCIEFHIISGRRQGQVIRVSQPEILILGRDVSCAFCVGDDPYFSRNHCRLEVSPPACRLVDLGSTNGTLVNNVPVSVPLELVDGDIIGGGDTFVRVQVVQQSVSSLLQANEYNDQDGEQLDKDIAALKDLLGEPVLPELCLPRPSSKSKRLLIEGSIVGGYEVLRELGKGGMGVVYQVRHVRTRGLRALKLITPTGDGRQSQTQVQMFLREASLLLKLKHPRIVEAIEIGIHNELPFLIMEYIETLDLVEIINKQNRAKSIRMACWVILQTLDALEAAHATGTVHRDVKPANILAYRTGQQMQVKLSDFGLAKQYQEAGFSDLTHDSDLRGTLTYMAPEQVTDSRYCKPQVDLYSSCATLYYLLSGQHHFDSTHYSQTVQNLLTRDPIPLSERVKDVPESLANIVDQGLRLNPTLRWQTAVQLRDALRPFGVK